MAASLKLLLLKNEEGNAGLKAIRDYESDMIDIADYADGISDATSTTNPQYVIKNDIVYRIIKTYFDFKTNTRVFLAREDMSEYDYKDPNSIASISISPTSVILRPGDTQKFTINKRNIPDGETIVLSISGNTSSATNITQDGVLTIGADEEHETVIRIIASIASLGLEVTSRVTVLKEPVLVLEPENATMNSNETYSFTITSEYIPSGNTLLTYVTGNTSALTKFDSNGLLTLGSSETSENIIVNAEYRSLKLKETSNVTIVYPDPTISVTPETLDLLSYKGYNFTITTENMRPTQSVIASITNNTDINTTISNTGELIIGDDETSDNITLTFTISGTSISDSVSVNILYPSVIISPKNVDLNKGDEFTFTTTSTNVESEYELSYILTGNTSNETFITDNGLLTIASNETSETLIVEVNYELLNISDSANVNINQTHESTVWADLNNVWATYSDNTWKQLEEGEF